MIICARYHAVAVTLTAIVFSPWLLHTSFLADDWPILARTIDSSWSDVPGWFLHLRAGWYRPLSESYMLAAWRLFGLQPIGYHLTAAGLYALTAGNIGLILERLTGDDTIAFTGVVVFCLFAPHTEPVLWLAAVNSLLMTCLVTMSFLAYLAFHRPDRQRAWSGWGGMAALFWLLAVSAKETALAFPLVVLTYDLLFWAQAIPLPEASKRGLGQILRPRVWRQLVPAVLLVCTAAFIVPLRLAQGSIYSDAFSGVGWTHLLRLVENGLYFVTISLLALPKNYAYVATLPLWRSAPLLPVALLIITSATLLSMSVEWWRQRNAPTCRYHNLSLMLAAVWIASALAPVLPIPAERTVFLASVGMAMGLAVMLTSLWQRGRMRRWLVVLYLAAHLVTFHYRGYWWRTASTANVAVLAQLSTNLAAIQSTQPRTMSDTIHVVLLGLPDHIGYVPVFRNAFPYVARVLSLEQTFTTYLDTELAALSPEQKKALFRQLHALPQTQIFWYADGHLVSTPPD